MSSVDQLMHLIRHGAAQAAGDTRTHVYGHIAAYDPVQHRARCIVPSLTDDTGAPLLTPWMPLGAPWQGAQYIYKGGSSPQNPTAGEQVLIGLFDRYRGVAAVPCTFYNAGTVPPANSLPSSSNGYPANAAELSGGDLLISNPSAGQSPTLIRIRGDTNDIEMWGAAKLNIQTLGDVSAVTQNGSMNVTATNGDVNVTATNGNTTITAKGLLTFTASAMAFGKAVSDALQTLCTRAFHDWAATHQHSTGGPPITQPPANSLTTVMEAE